jgi:hypothetical protein
MTAYRACNGVVEIGATPDVVGEVTAYSINAAADEIDTSSMGTCTASSVAGNKKTTGTISMNYDADDAGQLEMVIGTKPQLIVYPYGKNTGDPVWTAAEATILQLNVTAEVNGVVAADMSYSINGEFVITDGP